MAGASRRLVLATFSALGASAAFQTRLAAQGAHQQAAIRMVLGLLGGQDAFLNLHGDPGVIAGDLPGPSATNQVAPAVAHVPHRQAAALDHHHDDGAAHAGARVISLGVLVDGDVRFGDGVLDGRCVGDVHLGALEAGNLAASAGEFGVKLGAELAAGAKNRNFCEH